MYVFYFKIADIVFKVMSNQDVEIYFFEHQPYNLNINYFLSKLDPSLDLIENVTIHIDLENAKKLELHVENNFLKISGDYSEMFLDTYNKQFGLFGNKGIINSFILSILEKNNYIVLHGCAIIHPISKKTLIGIGCSGSGKSLFVSQALSLGWQLLGTEHIIISIDKEIFLGNYLDNCSKKSLEYVESELAKAVIYKDKILQDPTFMKILVNFSEYQHKEQKILLNNYTFVILNFGNAALSKGILCNKIDDFVLRELQITASEKISMPIVFGSKIYNNKDFLGDVSTRSHTVVGLLHKSDSVFALGGSADSFRDWLSTQYEKHTNG